MLNAYFCLQRGTCLRKKKMSILIYDNVHYKKNPCFLAQISTKFDAIIVTNFEKLLDIFKVQRVCFYAAELHGKNCHYLGGWVVGNLM